MAKDLVFVHYIFLKIQFHLSFNIKKKTQQTLTKQNQKFQHSKHYEQNFAHFKMFLPPAVSNDSWVAQCLLTWTFIHKDDQWSIKI